MTCSSRRVKTRTAKSRHAASVTKRVCRITPLPSGSRVAADLRRGKVVYALGHARATRTGVLLTLHALRATPHGRYTLVLVVGSGARAVTVKRTVTL